MSRFYGSLQGNHGEATRQGDAKGIFAHIRGWNLGIFVSGGVHYDDSKLDVFNVTVTGGSNEGPPYFTLADIFECRNGARRVSIALLDGGRSVYYVQPDGRRTNQEEG